MNIIKYLRKVIPHNSPLRLWYTRLWQVAALLLVPINTGKIKLIGVTGTDGKTTTVEMAAHILGELGVPYLSTSSLETKINGEVLAESKRTTPSLWQLHKLLKLAIKSGAKVVVIEVSSHALSQWRVLGLQFDAAVLTNITHEHLNYHKTIENYAAAKKLLFIKHLRPDGKAILPTNDNYGAQWLAEFKEKGVEYTPPEASTTKDGTTFIHNDATYTLPMLGGYNAGNALAAALAVHSLQIPSKQAETAKPGFAVDTDSALRSLSNFAGIPGRMQLIPEASDLGFTVIVDFALTERAMQSALNAAREVAMNTGVDNKVFVVYGATGGQHDTSVRPGLAKSAATGADRAIVTDDEPYDGDPAEIRADLMRYMQDTNRQNTKLGGRAAKLENIADRREAIAYALSQASTGDVIIVSGMGHYTSRTVGGQEVPWNDTVVIKEEITKLHRI